MRAKMFSKNRSTLFLRFLNYRDKKFLHIIVKVFCLVGNTTHGVLFRYISHKHKKNNTNRSSIRGQNNNWITSPSFHKDISTHAVDLTVLVNPIKLISSLVLMSNFFGSNLVTWKTEIITLFTSDWPLQMVHWIIWNLSVDADNLSRLASWSVYSRLNHLLQGIAPSWSKKKELAVSWHRYGCI